MFNEVTQAGTHRAQFGQSFAIPHPVNKKVEYPVRYGISLSRSCEAMPSVISGRSARYAHPASALLVPEGIPFLVSQDECVVSSHHFPRKDKICLAMFHFRAGEGDLVSLAETHAHEVEKGLGA
jgi:hypothetical protein